MILKGSKMVAGGKDLRASGEQSATPGKLSVFPMSLWRLSRQSDMGSFIWLRTPGVALAALVYPRLPSLTTSWSVPNAHEPTIFPDGPTKRTIQKSKVDEALGTT